MPGKAQGLLVLTDDERETLLRWTRRAKSSPALAMRSRIVLACADGAPNTAVAARLGVSRNMVGKRRSPFIAKRLEGLSDEPRPGAPRKLTDDAVEAVAVATLEQIPPRGDSHWSTRSMAKAVGLNQTAVSRIWRAFGLKPHLVDDWKRPYFDCMRQHGVPEPEPDAKGMVHQPTDWSWRSTPEYTAALAACRDLYDDPANNQPENK